MRHETSADPPPLLEAIGLKRHFSPRNSIAFWRAKDAVRALDGVSFRVLAGDGLSIVGESGCGKSTLAKLLIDVDRPTEGAVYFKGENVGTAPRSKWREYRVGVQAVLQNPSGSLNPKSRIGNIIAEPLLINRRMSRGEVGERVADLLREVSLDPALARAFPHELSGGMRQRVAIAQALALNPSVIVLDEPVSSLDVSIRAQILNLLKRLRDTHNISYIMITHDLGTVRYLGKNVAAMYAGRFVESAAAEAFFSRPLHPYTIALVSAVGSIRRRQPDRIVLSGEAVSNLRPAAGCSFQPRCWLCARLGSPSVCSTSIPQEREAEAGHAVACHFTDELLDPGRRVGHLRTALS